MKIAGERFELRPADVVRTVSRLDPEPIARHFVVVGAHRYPPKQVIEAMTGLDRADFTTHQARRTLMRLGFAVGRRDSPAPASPSTAATSRPSPAPMAQRLRPLAGQWVALKDDDVLHAASSPQRLVGWLAQHGQVADSMFRVPEDEVAATGLAPL